LNIRQFKTARKLHQYIGLISAVFFLILAVTGVLLMHYESLGMNGVTVSGRFLPEKYFRVAGDEAAIQALAASPSGALFAGTASGLYRSVDEGASWSEVKQGLFSQDIRALAVDRTNPRMVYAGTPRGLFRSDDGGETFADWFDQASGLAGGAVNAIALHPNDGDNIYVATEGGLFTSDDAGESWTRAFKPESGEAARDVVLSASEPGKTLYLLLESGTLRSEDGGRSWQAVWSHALPPLSALLSLRAEPEFLYAASASGLYKSFNRGQSWIKDPHDEVEDASALFASSGDISHLTLASADGLFTTTDGGDTWRAAKPLPESHGRITRLAKTGKGLLAGSTAGLFISQDGGKSWREGNIPASGQAEKRMDLVKLITEIHTGRFFGNYFMLLVDLATVGLVVLVVSGFIITYYRSAVKARKKILADEAATDREIEIMETASDLSAESMAIHDMIEHIGNHLDKCKSIYLTKEKKEIDEIDRHITTLDQKVHHLMERIDELEGISKNGG